MNYVDINLAKRVYEEYEKQEFEKRQKLAKQGLKEQSVLRFNEMTDTYCLEKEIVSIRKI